MSTNISEFERAKPTKTYEHLSRLIKKYSSNCNTEEMDEEDAITKKISKEVKDDLLRFKQTFLTGE
mgnify:CR=1 FL=1|tara:strand:- start:296 stop:493 length:198 start_codon:yes stop_codon:yes gene_type:complete